MCLLYYFYSFIPTNVFLAFTRKTITLVCIESIKQINEKQQYLKYLYQQVQTVFVTFEFLSINWNTCPLSGSGFLTRGIPFFRWKKKTNQHLKEKKMKKTNMSIKTEFRAGFFFAPKFHFLGRICSQNKDLANPFILCKKIPHRKMLNKLF